MSNRTDRQASLLAAGITERLEQLGMSRRELSRRANLSRQTIHNIEKEGATNLKPSTLEALDVALRWESGTALALALGQGNRKQVQERITEYLARIAFHLSQMDTDQLELTLIMLEEHELGSRAETTAEFTRTVGRLVENTLREVAAAMGEGHQPNGSELRRTFTG